MTPLAWAWLSWSCLMTGACGFLWWRLEEERKRNLELQDQRVRDAMSMATTGSPEPPEPEIQKVEDPEEKGARAVRNLDRELIMDHLRRRAQEENVQVSDSKLREDAERMRKKFGLGPRAPNV